ncbi:MAG: hypothetical protein ACRENS_05445, partial [Candidatus Eiseniibacteriota bacterium]
MNPIGPLSNPPVRPVGTRSSDGDADSPAGAFAAALGMALPHADRPAPAPAQHAGDGADAGGEAHLPPQETEGCAPAGHAAPAKGGITRGAVVRAPGVISNAATSIEAAPLAASVPDAAISGHAERLAEAQAAMNLAAGDPDVPLAALPVAAMAHRATPAASQSQSLPAGEPAGGAASPRAARVSAAEPTASPARAITPSVGEQPLGKAPALSEPMTHSPISREGVPNPGALESRGVAQAQV